MIGFTHGIIGASAVSSAVPVSTDFIIKVKTDNAGTSGSNQFTLPTTTGTYDYTVDWGDGVVENITSSSSQTHTYPSAGTYTIKISGTFPRIFFNNGGDMRKLIETINFGDVGWTSMERAFWGCENMDINPNAVGVFGFGINYTNAWRNCSSLTSFPALDLSGGTNFATCWFGCSSMLEFNVTALGIGSYQEAWGLCSSLTSFPALDLSGGNNFIASWTGCSSMSNFPALDLSGGTSFSSTFRNWGTVTSFATRNFYNMTIGTNAFLGTTLPTSDYSDILITQRANNSNTGVTFHGGNSKYNPAGGTARGELVSVQSWSITDGGAE